MPRPNFLLLVLSLLGLPPAGLGFLNLNDSGVTPDSGWEMDPNG